LCMRGQFHLNDGLSALADGRGQHCLHGVKDDRVYECRHRQESAVVQLVPQNLGKTML
jgi:hypothetical protein